MRRLTFLSILFAFNFAHSAQQIQIKAELFIHGQKVSSPTVITRTGETAEINQVSDGNELKLKVVATEGDNDGVPGGILLKFDIEYVTDGRIHRSSPQILTLPGEASSIHIGDESGKEELGLKVITTRM